MTCHAARLPIAPYGWQCTGENLIVVGGYRHGGVDIPIVAPADRLADVPDSLPIRIPFTGRDHLHAVLPEEPPCRSST